MQTEQNERSKMLGTMPMGKLVPKISIPIMISMLVQALYNVVDSIFVARYDANALAAVSLGYPVQMLMVAVSVGLATGINSLMSRRLGEKDPAAARRAAWTGLIMECAGYLIFLVVGLFFVTPIFHALTDDPLLQELGIDYLSVACTWSFGIFIAVTMERMLQATGNSSLSMVTQLAGAITNIVLDPIMIFGLLGCPKMGITGAAVATVIGQHVSMIAGLILNQKKNAELKLMVKDCRPDKRTVGGILSVGLPSVVMQSVSSVMNLLFNMILLPFGATAVSVLGVYFKLQSFVFMPVFGLSNGMVPIVGYNYGARLKTRVYNAISVCLKIAIGIMLVGMLAFLIFPQALMSLFESGDASELTELGVRALRVISSHFLLAAVGIILSTVFQAVGKGTYSLIISLCRQLIVLIPVAWALASLGGLEAVWWAFPIAELVSLVLCLLFYRKCDREMLSRL